jgi:low affinity Fe/Cu permease
MHVKLDEVIRALEGAHNALLDLEELDEDMLDKMRLRYRNLAKKARDDIKAGGADIGCEEVEGESDQAGIDKR